MTVGNDSGLLAHQGTNYGAPYNTPPTNEGPPTYQYPAVEKQNPFDDFGGGSADEKFILRPNGNVVVDESIVLRTLTDKICTWVMLGMFLVVAGGLAYLAWFLRKYGPAGWAPMMATSIFHVLLFLFFVLWEPKHKRVVRYPTVDAASISAVLSRVEPIGMSDAQMQRLTNLLQKLNPNRAHEVVVFVEYDSERSPKKKGAGRATPCKSTFGRPLPGEIRQVHHYKLDIPDFV